MASVWEAHNHREISQESLTKKGTTRKQKKKWGVSGRWQFPDGEKQGKDWFVDAYHQGSPPVERSLAGGPWTFKSFCLESLGILDSLSRKQIRWSGWTYQNRTPLQLWKRHFMAVHFRGQPVSLTPFITSSQGTRSSTFTIATWFRKFTSVTHVRLVAICILFFPSPPNKNMGFLRDG